LKNEDAQRQSAIADTASTDDANADVANTLERLDALRRSIEHAELELKLANVRLERAKIERAARPWWRNWNVAAITATLAASAPVTAGVVGYFERQKQVALAEQQQKQESALVAESLRSIALRGFLGRLLGWSPEHMQDVDLALRATRIAKRRQGALVLCGKDKLALLARSLHHRVLGADRPFVMCDPRRGRVDESIRAALNYQSAMEALPAARDGSLCIWTSPPPPDIAELKLALKNPDTRVQLIVCGTDPREAELLGVLPIAVPMLSSRTKDLPRIIEEYAHEITADLGLDRSSFPRGDQSWVLHHSSGSLPEIEQAIFRILRLREVDGDRNEAADLLGMSKSYLNKWIKSRNPPIPMKGKSLKADE